MLLTTIDLARADDGLSDDQNSGFGKGAFGLPSPSEALYRDVLGRSAANKSLKEQETIRNVSLLAEENVARQAQARRLHEETLNYEAFVGKVREVGQVAIPLTLGLGLLAITLRVLK